MDVYCVMALGDFPIILAGRADRAHQAQGAGLLIYGQHPGNAAFGQYFIDDIRLAVPLLGKGFSEVVEHDGHRARPGEIVFTG